MGRFGDEALQGPWERALRLMASLTKPISCAILPPHHVGWVVQASMGVVPAASLAGGFFRAPDNACCLL